MQRDMQKITSSADLFHLRSQPDLILYGEHDLSNVLTSPFPILATQRDVQSIDSALFYPLVSSPDILPFLLILDPIRFYFNYLHMHLHFLKPLTFCYSKTFTLDPYYNLSLCCHLFFKSKWIICPV